jgi:hypothetical protein
MARKINNCTGMIRGQSRKLALTWAYSMERVTGIEPALSAWEADVLPLNYTRVSRPAPRALPSKTPEARTSLARISYRNPCPGSARRPQDASP